MEIRQGNAVETLMSASGTFFACCGWQTSSSPESLSESGLVVSRTEPQAIKKADVAEHPEVFHHVGLQSDAPPERLRAVLHHVIRKRR